MQRSGLRFYRQIDALRHALCQCRSVGIGRDVEFLSVRRRLPLISVLHFLRQVPDLRFLLFLPPADQRGDVRSWYDGNQVGADAPVRRVHVVPADLVIGKVRAGDRIFSVRVILIVQFGGILSRIIECRRDRFRPDGRSAAKGHHHGRRGRCGLQNSSHLLTSSLSCLLGLYFFNETARRFQYAGTDGI